MKAKWRSAALGSSREAATSDFYVSRTLPHAAAICSSLKIRRGVKPWLLQEGVSPAGSDCCLFLLEGAAAPTQNVLFRWRLEKAAILPGKLRDAFIAHLEGGVAGGEAFVEHEPARLEQAKSLLVLPRRKRGHVLEVLVKGREAHGGGRCQALDGKPLAIFGP